MGEIEVKNIARPIRAFRIAGQASSEPQTPTGRPTKRRKPLTYALIAAALAAIGALAVLQPWKPDAETARLNPGFVGNMVWRAAAHAQAGNQDIAEQVAAELLAKAPDWTISGNFVQIKDPGIMALLNDGLRKAGLPE